MKRRAFLATAAALPALRTAAEAQAKGGMRLGVIAMIGKDPDAGVRRVHDLGFPTCQLYAGPGDPALVTWMRESPAAARTACA